MKFLNTNIEIGDIVLIEEKYKEEYHNLKSNRLHLGFIEFIDSSKNISIVNKKLITWIIN